MYTLQKKNVVKIVDTSEAAEKLLQKGFILKEKPSDKATPEVSAAEVPAVMPEEREKDGPKTTGKNNK